MKSLPTDIEIVALFLVLLPLIAIVGWRILNALGPLLPRWLRRQLG
jgi:hypothetical protein